MKTYISWLCALFGVVAAIICFRTNRQQAAELAALRPKTQEVEQLRAEIDLLRTSGSESQQREIAHLRKSYGELLQLRSEVTQLRDSKSKLSQQVSRLETERTSVQESQARQPAEFQQIHALKAEAASNATVMDESATAASDKYINNLRQLDGAKQQWALEYGKRDTDAPRWEDLAPYIPGDQPPQCPVSGVYTIGTVNADPTCSIPSHALPTR